jgi:hypothetical protein
MTTFGEYLAQIKPIPGFDSKKWLRKRHAEIQRENEGLTDEQIRERLRRSSEEFQEEIKRRRTELAKAESAGN